MPIPIPVVTVHVYDSRATLPARVKSIDEGALALVVDRPLAAGTALGIDLPVDPHRVCQLRARVTDSAALPEGGWLVHCDVAERPDRGWGAA
jgi:hypothetical protein